MLSDEKVKELAELGRAASLNVIKGSTFHEGNVQEMTRLMEIAAARAIAEAAIRDISRPEFADSCADSSYRYVALIEAQERIRELEAALTNLYECRYEPDKLLAMLERHKALKGGKP